MKKGNKLPKIFYLTYALSLINALAFIYLAFRFYKMYQLTHTLGIAVIWLLQILGGTTA